VELSTESNEVVVAIGAAPCSAPPSPPVGLTSTLSGQLASLNWSAPGTITSSVLDAGYTAGASNAAVIVLDPSARTFSSNAPPGTYYVRARAVNALGSRAGSNEVIITVP
jgi:hypothetical protein